MTSLNTAQAANAAYELIRLSAFGPIAPATVKTVVDKASIGVVMLGAANHAQVAARSGLDNPQRKQVLGYFGLPDPA